MWRVEKWAKVVGGKVESQMERQREKTFEEERIKWDHGRKECQNNAWFAVGFKVREISFVGADSTVNSGSCNHTSQN